MPAIKSSSKSGDKLVLFADERKAIAKAALTANWILNRVNGDPAIYEIAMRARDANQELLEHLTDAAANPTGRNAATAFDPNKSVDAMAEAKRK